MRITESKILCYTLFLNLKWLCCSIFKNGIHKGKKEENAYKCQNFKNRLPLVFIAKMIQLKIFQMSDPFYNSIMETIYSKEYLISLLIASKIKMFIEGLLSQSWNFIHYSYHHLFTPELSTGEATFRQNWNQYSTKGKNFSLL